MADIKEKIQDLVEEVVEKLKGNPTLLAQFKTEPVKALEKLIGKDLPDEQIEKVISLVKAKLLKDKIEDSVDEFVTLVSQVMSDKPLFFLINSYTTGLSPLTMKYIIDMRVANRFGGKTEVGELGLKVTQTGGYLPCGASARWQSDGADEK